MKKKAKSKTKTKVREIFVAMRSKKKRFPNQMFVFKTMAQAREFCETLERQWPNELEYLFGQKAKTKV